METWLSVLPLVGLKSQRHMTPWWAHSKGLLMASSSKPRQQCKITKIAKGQYKHGAVRQTWVNWPITEVIAGWVCKLNFIFVPSMDCEGMSLAVQHVALSLTQWSSRRSNGHVTIITAPCLMLVKVVSTISLIWRSNGAFNDCNCCAP